MAPIKRYEITAPYLDLHCGLGEAPFWDAARNTLRFVDIVHKRLHFVDLAAGPASHRQWDLPFSVGTTADIEGDDAAFVFGGKLGYGIMDRATGESRWLAKMWNEAERREDGGGKPKAGRCKEERMRSNDGAVDARGRYFVGAMNDPEQVGKNNFTDEGILFRLDPDLSLHRVKEGVTIPNGTSWTLDGRTMYFTDSPSRRVMAYPYDLDTGAVAWTEGTPFFTCPDAGGVPDGHAQDAEGCLWIACFGAGKVVRVSPAGAVLAEVACPTRCVTCPAFCGTELVVTSAAEEEPARYPWSVAHQGGVFKVDVGVRGAPLNKFRLAAPPPPGA